MNSPDPRSIESFLSQHQGIAYKVARSFALDDNDFDDLFQEICIGIWGAFGRIPEGARESTYAYRIALNRAISWQRKQKSYLKHLTAFWKSQSRASLKYSSESNPQVDLMYAAIRRLPEADRSVLLLYLDQLDANQMSEILGIESASVRKRVSRAKQKLARIIREMGN